MRSVIKRLALEVSHITSQPLPPSPMGGNGNPFMSINKKSSAIGTSPPSTKLLHRTASHSNRSALTPLSVLARSATSRYVTDPSNDKKILIRYLIIICRTNPDSRSAHEHGSNQRIQATSPSKPEKANGPVDEAIQRAKRLRRVQGWVCSYCQKFKSSDEEVWKVSVPVLCVLSSS